MFSTRWYPDQSLFGGTRGRAYDAKNKRLFVANHTGAPFDNLVILPVP